VLISSERPLPRPRGADILVYRPRARVVLSGHTSPRWSVGPRRDFDLETLAQKVSLSSTRARGPRRELSVTACCRRLAAPFRFYLSIEGKPMDFCESKTRVVFFIASLSAFPLPFPSPKRRGNSNTRMPLLCLGSPTRRCMHAFHLLKLDPLDGSTPTDESTSHYTSHRSRTFRQSGDPHGGSSPRARWSGHFRNGFLDQIGISSL
jgi:hypothetical protein